MEKDNTINEDINLVKLCKQGDKNAFDQLTIKYQNKIYSMIFRSVGDNELAADLTQETFINAYKGISHFKEHSSFFTWLFRIAINNIKNAKRKKNRFVSLFKKDESCETTTWIEPIAKEKTPEHQLEDDEKNKIIQSLVQSLEEPFKTALILRDIEELSYEEMQEILECPIGTVRSRIHRARNMMKEKLENFFNSMELK